MKITSHSNPVETGLNENKPVELARKQPYNRAYYTLCYKTNGAHWNLQRINNNNQLDLQLLDNISKLKFCKIITNRQLKMAYKNSIYVKWFNQSFSPSMMSYFMSHKLWLILTRESGSHIDKVSNVHSGPGSLFENFEIDKS